MIIKHDGATPRIDPTAWVAPNAAICGSVTIGPSCRVMFGAQVIAEGGSISIGCECIIMENAVLRSSARHSLSIANNCLIGPNAHVSGAPLRTRSSLPLALRSSTQRTSARAARCASTEWCTSRPISPLEKPSRLVGSRWEIQPNCYRRASMSASGISRSRSTFHSPSMASSGARRRRGRSRIVCPRCYSRMLPMR